MTWTNCGNKEVIDNAGITYNFNDSDDLACKLQYLIDNPQELEKYGALAKKRIEENYSWEVVANQYEKLFESLVKKKGTKNGK